jgi:SecD/SecF fusion protein
MMNHTVKIVFPLVFLFFFSCGGDKKSNPSPQESDTSLGDSVRLEFWEVYEDARLLGYFEEANDLLSEHLYPGFRKVVRAEREKTRNKSDKINDTIGTISMGSTEKSNAEDELLNASRAKLNIDSIKVKEEEALAKGWDDYKKEKLKTDPLLSLFEDVNVVRSRGFFSGGVVGYAYKEDTAQINAYLNHDVTFIVWPNDIVFRWAAKVSRDKRKKPSFALYALKRTVETDGPLLVVNQIKKARATAKDGPPRIVFQLNTKDAGEWQKITRKYLKKSIALTLGDKVYSVPMIQAEISGGGTTMTGDYTIQEAQHVADRLMGIKK